MPTPAQILTRSVRDVFAMHGWVTFRCAAGMVRTEGGRMVVYGTKGAPDLVAIKGQRYCLLELKTKHDKMQPSQTAFAQEVGRVYGNYAIIRSVDDAMKIIQGE